MNATTSVARAAMATEVHATVLAAKQRRVPSIQFVNYSSVL